MALLVSPVSGNCWGLQLFLWWWWWFGETSEFLQCWKGESTRGLFARVIVGLNLQRLPQTQI